MNKLNKKVMTMWLTKGCIIFLASLVIYVPLIIFLSEFARQVVIIVGGIILVLVVLCCFGYPILKYKYYAYSYDEKRVIIHRGIIFRHRIVIPVCQIQDLHSFQGPFLMLFQLSGIILSTAGSNFQIIGLSKDEVKTMINELEEYLNQRIGELKNEEIH